MNPYAQGHAMPGMEFFQSMLKGAGLPTGFASWMAPTMDPQELEQKITDLKAVLQWLEANARLTQATIQTLEVQRMTLAALKTMNVDLGDLAGRMAEAMQAGAQSMGATTHEASAKAAEEPVGTDGGDASPAQEKSSVNSEPVDAEQVEASALPGMMDPMQWWNAVSQQFTQVATQALRDSPWPMPQGASMPPSAPGSTEAPTAKPVSTGPAAKTAKPPRAASPKGAVRKAGARQAAGRGSSGVASKTARKRST